MRSLYGVQAQLLLYAIVIVIGSTALLAWNTGQAFWTVGTPIVIFSAAAVILHLFFRFRSYQASPILLPIVFLVNGFGLLLLLSIQSDAVTRQTAFSIIGLLLWAASAYWGIWESLRHVRYISGVGAIALLVATALFGRQIGGARAWLDIGPVQFQPSELGKILLIVFLAGVLADMRYESDSGRHNTGPLGWGKLAYLGPVVTVWVLAMLTLVAQRDLGAALLFSGILMFMLVAATGSWVLPVIGLGAGGIGALLAVKLFSHVRSRFDAWLHPWDDPTGVGYQPLQALYALAAGGVTGVGPGLGMAEVVPAASTDYILAVLGEEWGFAGVSILLCCYFLLMWQGVQISLRMQNRYGQLLALGIVGMFASQVFLVGGGVSRLIPLTGITTPFLSAGGSSLLTNYLAIGLLGNLSHAVSTAGQGVRPCRGTR